MRARDALLASAALARDEDRGACCSRRDLARGRAHALHHFGVPEGMPEGPAALELGTEASRSRRRASPTLEGLAREGAELGRGETAW